MRGQLRCAVLKPRQAVIEMAPYSPPTGAREEKVRLDFNEHTVGCSPQVIEFLREKLTADVWTTGRFLACSSFQGTYELMDRFLRPFLSTDPLSPRSHGVGPSVRTRRIARP